MSIETRVSREMGEEEKFSLEERIEAAESLSQLCDELVKEEEIESDSGSKYKSADVINSILKIEQFLGEGVSQLSETHFSYITRAKGIREKVRQLVFEVESTPENAKTKLEAETFDELYEAIRQIGEVKGSKDRKYDPETIIEEIKGIEWLKDQKGGAEVKESGYVFGKITRANGIRKKVVELINQYRKG